MNREPLEVADDTPQQMAALALMNALHRAGFTSLLLDSVTMFSGGRLSEPGRPKQIRHQHCRVVVMDDDLGVDRMAAILDVANEYEARVVLCPIRGDNRSFSRIALWPSYAGDE